MKSSAKVFMLATLLLFGLSSVMAEDFEHDFGIVDIEFTDYDELTGYATVDVTLSVLYDSDDDGPVGMDIIADVDRDGTRQFHGESVSSWSKVEGWSCGNGCLYPQCDPNRTACESAGCRIAGFGGLPFSGECIGSNTACGWSSSCGWGYVCNMCDIELYWILLVPIIPGDYLSLELEPDVDNNSSNNDMTVEFDW